MERWQINRGWLLELIPFDPPPVMQGLTLVGWVEWLDWPRFGLNYGWTATGFGASFLIGGNGRVTRETDGSVYDVGGTMSAEAVHAWEAANRSFGSTGKLTGPDETDKGSVDPG